MKILKEHFFAQTDASVARQLFALSVRQVEVGISSYCNRTCSYCPNVSVDRTSTNNLLAADIFKKIVSDLAQIDYAGTMSLHRYNEPLADFDYALSCIAHIRETLPKTLIRVFSNGDYLNAERLQTLIASGIAQLIISTHAPSGTGDFEKAKLRQEALLKKLGVGYRFTEDSAAHRVAMLDLPIAAEITARNFFHTADDGKLYMSDRGQSVTTTAEAPQFVRHHPCLIPFWDVQIDWDGSMLPCCNVHPDVPAHKDFIIERFTPETDLFLVWGGQKYAEWRRSLFSYDVKGAPCTTCNMAMTPDDEPTRAFVENCRATFFGG